MKQKYITCEDKITRRNKQKFLQNEEWKEVDLQKKEGCDETVISSDPSDGHRTRIMLGLPM